ncbi:MAG TPA: hypothetical protein VK475_09820 [Pyrinomonadaceae bacterium]|nr:hypothetical protein [Pyrinomonadaceae bacterium]
MATKKKAAKKPRQPGDSPINIGGGGGKRKVLPYVELWFDHDDYVPDPDDKDNFVSEANVLSSLLLNSAPKGAITRNSEIVIEYKKGGNSGEIIVTGIPPGVRFNGKKLRYKAKRHHGDDWQLKTLTIDNTTTNLAIDDQIEIHTTLARRRRRSAKR